MTNPQEQSDLIYHWLKIVCNAILGGAFLALLIGGVFVLGLLAEALKQ